MSNDQFLAEVRGLKHKNVAAELLEKAVKTVLMQADLLSADWAG